MYRILSTCKGGGYRYCRTDPPHPSANSNGLYPLHRVLMENILGRPLAPGEVVHHRDENKWNDDPANLELLTRAEHSRHHAPTVPSVHCVCPVCGRVFALKPAALRLRRRRAKGGLITCSRRCGGRASTLRPHAP